MHPTASSRHCVHTETQTLHRRLIIHSNTWHGSLQRATDVILQQCWTNSGLTFFKDLKKYFSSHKNILLILLRSAPKIHLFIVGFAVKISKRNKTLVSYPLQRYLSEYWQTRKPSYRWLTRATRKPAKNCSNSTCLQRCRWQYALSSFV